MPALTPFKFVSSALLALFACAAFGQAYPSKPIVIVVPYTTGGAADSLARTAAEIIQKDLGQPVVVDNKPGAGGSMGLEFVARAAPDGYTFGLTASGSIGINPHVYKLRYNPVEDLTAVTILAEVPFVVVANNDFGVRTLEELKALGRQKPGAISSGNAGIGTQAHLTQVMIANAAGIELNIIGYKGSAPAVNDLLGGHLNTMIDNTAVQAPFIKSGKVRPLFVTSDRRTPALPDVPTAQEAGLPGFKSVAWFGLAAPKATPPEILSRVQSAIARGFERAESRKMLDAQGLIPVTNTPREAQERSVQEYKNFGGIVKQLNLKLE